MARKDPLTPAAIDRLETGRIRDPHASGLRIEALRSGTKRWRLLRRLARTNSLIKMLLGGFPTGSIAEASDRAKKLDEQLEAGIEPRSAAKEEQARTLMTVERAHGLYMVAVREGRSSRAKRPNKPRTVSDKLEIYNRDIDPTLGRKCIHEVTEADLARLVTVKGKTARIRANRLAAELKVFFGWAASLRGMEVGLESDPSRRLHELRFPETARSRNLSLQEIEWFLLALAHEDWDYQRGMLVWLLTAARLGEVIEARSDELVGDTWTIPAWRTKNMVEHQVALGPWGRFLMQSNCEWVFPAPKIDGPRSRCPWYKARNRVWKRMEKLAGRPIERFTPHDFRRTVRSNTKRLNVDFETAEAMLNHVKKGLERTYDRYDLEEEKRTSFLKWEAEIAEIAWRAGLAEKLGVPSCYRAQQSARSAANDYAEIQPPSAPASTREKCQGFGRPPSLRAGFSLSSRFQFGSGSGEDVSP